MEVMDAAKWFIRHEDPESAGTAEGEERLQNLLMLSDMISVAKYGRPLFLDKPAQGEYKREG